MKTPIKTFLVAAIIASASVSLPATSAKYTVFGHGTTSCGSWTAEKAKDSWAYRGSWVMGFVSGVGIALGETYEADKDGMIGWVDNYCQANPMEVIAGAAEALVRELRK